MSGRRSFVANTQCMRQLTKECMILNSLWFCSSPTGTPENSPPFQRWEAMFGNSKSPGGAKEYFGDGVTTDPNPNMSDVSWFSFVPDGTRFVFLIILLTDKSVGYFLSPCRAGICAHCIRAIR